MKNKSPFLILIVASFILLSAAACKKSSGPSIIGKWALTETAYDANHNLKVDTAEENMITDYIYYTFNSDGSGTVSGPGRPYTALFDWQMLNGNQQLQIIYTTSTPDTNLFHIESLTDRYLELSYQTSGTVNWMFFTHQ